jgi:transposase
MSNNNMFKKRKSRGGRPSKFSPEFRRDAVALVLDEQRSIADVARSLGVNEGTLGNWVNKQRVERGEREGLSADERAELAEVRAENAQLRMERDLLKRSIAFWVKETSTS